MNTAQRAKILRHRGKFLERLQDIEFVRRTLGEINAIQHGGEGAILAVYERKGIARSTVRVGEEEILEGVALTDGRDWAALKELRERCRRIARLEKEAITPLIVLDETDCCQSSIAMRPLETVGIYVPDSMPSTLLLYCSLAQEAGVKHIVLALPPQTDGKIRPSLLAAASFFPAVSIIGVGGKSAFPALAFGLGGSLPNKLFGPCSFYVDTIKQFLATFYKIPVDAPAGPSELVIFVDEDKHAQQVEYDIRAQMEHGADSVCFLISTKSALLEKLRSALLDISSQVEYILAEHDGEAADLINQIAPEILELFSANPDELTGQLQRIANVYVNMPSPLGDYCYCGKGCADPTYGMASGLSGITIESFYKGSSISTGLKRPGSSEGWLTRLPELEGFPYHKRAIQTYLSVE